ncbi:MAG: hypothetical protein GKS06_02685 [Acidobacteria bacterium]|nr:hypothetical protein [Acidobacteriota bacterium]
MNHRLRSAFVVALVALVAIPATALAQEDMSVSMLMESAGEDSNEMTFTVAGDMARMDFAEMVSMIWSPDWMRMLQHQEQMWMEFNSAMLQQMRSMMGNVPGAPDVEDELDAFDPSNLSFEVTGNTDTVMGMEVFEVAFTAGDDNSGSMWMSEDAEVGIFEVFARMMTHLDSLAGPMMSGDNPAGDMQQYMAIAQAQGMPDGKILRMDSADGTRITMTGWEGGPFPEDTWAAPSSYQKQAMPFGW